MKTLRLFFLVFFLQTTLTAMATPPENYDPLWKTVDSLESKGLTRSAIEKVDAIYQKARAENNPVQQIKAVVHRIKFQSRIEEKSDSLNIIWVSSLIQEAQSPQKQIFQSLLAEIYLHYFQQNRYLIYERTATEMRPEDFQTWDATHFHHQISDLYFASIEPENLLKNESLKKYDPILIKTEESAIYRPTLYDLLAHRALDYFMSTESGITEHSEKFVLKNADVFVDAETFANLTFDTPDTHSRILHATSIFQRLLRFHPISQPEVFTDIEIKRLDFLKTHATGENTDTLYLRSLEHLASRLENQPASAEVLYKIATFYNNRANNYKPLETDQYRWDRKKALEICRQVTTRFSGTRGVQSCQALVASIEQINLNLKAEEVSLPDRPSRIFLSYKNLKQVYYRIIRRPVQADNYYPEKQLLEILLKETSVEQGVYTLIDEGDYQNHSVEIGLPPLSSGNYMVLLSSSQNYDPEEDIFSFGDITVSRLAWFYRNTNTGETELFITDRETGKPLKGVTVQRYNHDYSGNAPVKDGEPVYTDKNGYVSVPYKAQAGYFLLDFRYKNDMYRTERIYAYSSGDRTDIPVTRTFIFTDRKIYRPGQTIFFKAIVLQQTGENYEIRPDLPIKLTFFDVNSQEIGSQTLTTNNYGTVSGSFVAPTSGLMGQMSLQTEGGYSSVNVEEYKRPRFEVSFDPIEGDYRLGGKTMVKGKAVAYAGANLTDATVSYRVVREVRFPYWYGYFWRFPMPNSPAREIVNGTTTTDENGQFSIEFELIPDETAKKSQLPVFDYKVYADVVDITGETHSSQTTVRAGYVGMEADINVPERVVKSGKIAFPVTTQNLNGNFVPASGKITITALQAPDRVLRNRRWQQPDQHIISEETYRRDFPHDVYAGENDFRNWKEDSPLAEIPFNTAENKEISISQLANARPGKYKVVLTSVDVSGQEVKVIRYFSLTEAESSRPVVPQVLETSLSTEKAEPGETVNFTLSTSEKILWVVYEFEQDGKILERQSLRIKGKKGKKIAIPIKESYRGGVFLSVTAICHNEFFLEQKTIQVPWSNKQLTLSWSTFRDKLLPGQEEEWRLKISGPKSEAVAAEMVAAMYDVSLDQFVPNSYEMNLYENRYRQFSWNGYNGFAESPSRSFRGKAALYSYPGGRAYDQFNWFGAFDYYGRMNSGVAYMAAPRAGNGRDRVEDVIVSAKAEAPERGGEENKPADLKNGADTVAEGAESGGAPVSIRANLNETAFFFPHLETDADGSVILKFTMPEALTRWKFLGLAHTKDLKIGTLTGETVTQKDLMVTPNVPRFFREGDKMTLSAKVSNLSENDLAGTAELVLLDAFTRQPVGGLFDLNNASIPFSVKAKGNTPVSWEIRIPEEVQAVVVQVTARAGNFSDGEEHVIPVLKNRLLVTETLPLAVRGQETRTFEFGKLLNSGTSTTLRHQQLTLEFTSNPAWYAVQALPYLMEFPFDCTEQIFSRFYSNSLASHIASSSPNVRQVFEQWRTRTQGNESALLSNLEKNQELKSVLLEETPWVLNANSESERKKRIGLLFDLNRMSTELSATRQKLMERQLENGAFTWFPGMRPDRYMTQLIVTGFGHLQKIGVQSAAGNPEINQVVSQAFSYLDSKIREDYTYLVSHKLDREKDHIGSTQIQYLYARSFFPDIPLTEGTEEAYNFYYTQAERFWTSKSRYMQGMLALTFHRTEKQATGRQIIKSLKENAVMNPELGMYWKDNYSGYYWYESPVEQQALMIEAFYEVGGDMNAVEEMKVWLLKNKQTNDWKTTRATADACNALLSTGADWLEQNEIVAVTLGNVAVNPFEREDTRVEAGTGYFKTAWNSTELNAQMGKVTVSKKAPGIAWGGLYWQYFEQMDKITYAATPLSLKKDLFKVENTASGPQLVAVSETEIHPGDKIRVRIELRSDRDMEYVHMKDLRASAFEPVDVLSSYRYQAGLGYYQSTKDVATHFFFDYLPKGTHVFEYDLFATQKGDFSNGVATIQCMYAPEFTSHSPGVRVSVK
ncbi:MAG: alpha-2-macroglobulin family protein [Bacteroidia bacterium]|nr:alpha-2-macroglobulin family protein [Bacteroidia bacterium]